MLRKSCLEHTNSLVLNKTAQPQQPKDGPCARLPAESCSRRRHKSPHSTGWRVCSAGFQNIIFSLSAWEEQLGTSLPFMSLSSGALCCHPNTGGRQEDPAWIRCPRGTLVSAGPMQEDWPPWKTRDHTQKQRLILPSWLISVLAYHENHYIQLQKYNCLCHIGDTHNPEPSG